MPTGTPTQPALNASDPGLGHSGRRSAGHSAGGSGGRAVPALALLTALWLLSVPAACLFGPASLSPIEVLRVLAAMLGLMPASGLPESHLVVVGDIRLARTVLALLTGGGLALAGVAMQGVLHNPLAEPFLLGISSGAALGASTALALGPALAALWPVLHVFQTTAPAAMAGAFLALALALALGRGGGKDRLILAGVAVSAVFGAGVSLIKALDEESVSGIVFWIMGSFQGRGWADLPTAVLPMLPGLLLILPCWRALDVLTAGDRDAAHLGVNVGRVRLAVLLGAGALTAGCVAVSGIIGFVGLVAPHVLRRWLGPWHGLLLIAAWLAGGLFLLWADVLARCILPHGLELPVGVITALAGGPFFAFLLRQRKTA